MTEQSTERTDEKDLYPPDTQFGRAAAADAERADRVAEGGGDAEDMRTAPRDEVRAGDKARPEGEDEHAGTDPVDERSEESFPASDPPSMP